MTTALVHPGSSTTSSPTSSTTDTSTATAAASAAAALVAHPRRRTGRRGLATLVAGSLLTAVLGVSTPLAASAAPLTTTAFTTGRGSGGWGSSGSDGSSGSGGSYGSYGSGAQGTTQGSTQTGTVDSEAATSAESSGVALIDTVLTDGEAAGTGIVLTSDGEVLTNYHVVEGSTSIKVTIASSGKAYTATVVGADQTADVALLKLKDASGLTVAKIDDDTLRSGEAVTAVGNAGGTGTLTAAAGTVTALSASITTQSEGTTEGESLTKLIETDADVVPGDSGGPLLDAEGEVVGIDTAASSGQEIDGYAVPIATALVVVTQIRSGDETSAVRVGANAFLGVQVASSTATDPAYADGSAGDGTFGGAYGGGTVSGASAGTTTGATIAGVVSGDAADDAGLVAGDTVTRLGSATVTDAADLTTALATMNPGDKVTVTWTTSDGASRSATLTLDASPVN